MLNFQPCSPGHFLQLAADWLSSPFWLIGHPFFVSFALHRDASSGLLKFPFSYVQFSDPVLPFRSASEPYRKNNFRHRFERPPEKVHKWGYTTLKAPGRGLQ